MIFRRLRLKNYRKFQDKELIFTNGLNVIVGSNEAGKSTICHAILDCLFTDPATKAKSFWDNARSWSGNEDIYIELEFETSASKFLISKDFKSGKARLLNLDTKKEVNTYAETLVAIAKLTNIKSKNVFESTAFVHQSDLATIDSSDDFITAIQNVATASTEDVNVAQIISKLNKEIALLSKGLDRPVKHPGPIKDLQDRITELEEIHAQKKQSLGKLSKASVEGEQSTDKLKQIVDEISQLEKLISNHKKNKRAREELDKLTNSITKYEKKLTAITEAKKKHDQARAELVPLAAFDSVDIESDTKKITELSQTIKLQEQQLKEIREEQEARPQIVEEKVKPAQVGKIVPGVILFIGIVLAGIVYAVLQSFVVVTAVIGVTILIGIAAYKFMNSKTPVEFKPEPKVDKSVSVQEQLEVAKSDLQSILKKYQVTSFQDFFSNKAAYLMAKGNLSEQEATLKGLLSEQTASEIENEQLQLLTRKKEIETNELTEEVMNSELHAEEYLRKTRQLDNLYLEKKRMEEKKIASDVRLEDTNVTIDEVTALEEELEFKRQELDYNLQKKQVIALTVESIEQAVKETAETAGPVLSREIQTFLPELTMQRYKEIQVTDKLEIKVFAPEKNDWIDPVADLSRGTIDQIYFLARVAFLKLLLKDKQIPMILDDPFVTFDLERLTKTKKLVNELSKNFQILLFSHDQNYQDWGNLIKL